jgi:NADP-dependent 3-hydroxy acid dehydrogenase YdfG
MQCPGLRSIYSEFDLDFKAPLPSQTPVLFWQVKNYDDRFLRTEIAITALGAQGSIVAMLRPGPRQQPSTEEIRRRLPHHEQFAGRNALIIGGSRGLGEICAKLLAAGGADVCLTYHRGKDDADVVVGDIRQAGGKAINFAYDVLSPTHNLLSQFSSDWVPTHIYYFPTPPIFIANRNQFSPEIFEKFCQYYVNGFYACWSAVRAITPQKLVMLYPSSVAVETVYSNMGEYAAAKAAGENLCKFLVQTDRALQIKVARLPRLPSDQTLSLLEDDMEDPVEILLSQLQECKRRLKDA